jgi:methylglutaconyl-CoA hydratase
MYAQRRLQTESLLQVKLGVIPGAGGTQRAPRVIGLTRAKEAVFTGRMLTAQVAREWGELRIFRT